MRITRRELRRLIEKTLSEGSRVKLGDVSAKIVDGGIELNGERYELRIGGRFGPQITITSLDSTEEGVVVSGRGAGKDLRAPLSDDAVAVISNNVGEERFMVPGKRVSVAFVKSDV